MPPTQPYCINLVDRRRIELLPTRCKPVVLPLSLTAHCLVEIQGFEPRMPEATDLQSAEVTNASRSPNLVDAVGVEPTQSYLCAGGLQPLELANAQHIHNFNTLLGMCVLKHTGYIEITHRKDIQLCPLTRLSLSLSVL